jgi:hypothetical protein
MFFTRSADRCRQKSLMHQEVTICYDAIKFGLLLGVYDERRSCWLLSEVRNRRNARSTTSLSHLYYIHPPRTKWKSRSSPTSRVAQAFIMRMLARGGPIRSMTPKSIQTLVGEPEMHSLHQKCEDCRRPSHSKGMESPKVECNSSLSLLPLSSAFGRSSHTMPHRKLTHSQRTVIRSYAA